MRESTRPQDGHLKEDRAAQAPEHLAQGASGLGEYTVCEGWAVQGQVDASVQGGAGGSSWGRGWVMEGVGEAWRWVVFRMRKSEHSYLATPWALQGHDCWKAVLLTCLHPASLQGGTPHGKKVETHCSHAQGDWPETGATQGLLLKSLSLPGHLPSEG